MTHPHAPVSVIIPCYRSADTLGRAVESVVAQTRAVRQVVLVDDGSGDDTPAAMREQLRRYGSALMTLVFMPENRGVAVARNAGWEVASQPWIALLDSDDSWHERKVELQLAWHDAHPGTVLSSHARVLVGPADMPPLTTPITGHRVTARELLLSNRFQTSSVLMRRDLPFRFDVDRHHSEDYLLWLRIVLSGYEAWELDAPLCTMYKAVFGVAGISGNLWRTERMELAAYNRLRRYGLISPLIQAALLPLSLGKFARRLVTTRLRR